MFFVKRWTKEINDGESFKQTPISNKKIKRANSFKNKRNKVRASQVSPQINHQDRLLPQNPLLSQDENKVPPFKTTKDTSVFYDEDEIVLAKYQHLKTPEPILKAIKDATSPRKTTNSNSGTRIEIYMSSSHLDFFKDSLKYNEKQGSKCQNQPFMAYWPTFQHLDKRQLSWYFYWRGQVLKGNYLDTDLSYIFVFVYELLNYSFNPHAAFNVSMLTHLYHNYKDRHPKLTHYLTEWISDLLLELGETELAHEWVNRQIEPPFLYKMLQDQEKPLNKISITIWKRYIHSYRETKFFGEHKNKIYKTFKESIPLLQSCYEKGGKTLIGKWFEESIRSYSRPTFASAVMGREYLNIEVPEIYIVETKALNEVVTNLFRLSENIVRKQSGENREIKVDKSVLPKELEELMLNPPHMNRFKEVQTRDETMQGSSIPKRPKEETAKTSSRVNLKFDWEEIDQKNKDLERIKNQIETLEDDGETLSDTSATDENELRETEIEPKTATSQTVALSDVFNTNDSEDEFDDLVEELTSLEEEFLLLFKENQLSKPKANDFLKSRGLMLSVFLSELNEKADEFIDDVLVEENDDVIELIEDYEDILSQLRSERVGH